MNKELLKKKKEKPLFSKNITNKFSSNKEKTYEFAFYRIWYIFILSFAISFLIFTSLIYFQLRHFISPSVDWLRTSIVSTYIANDKIDLIDNQVKKLLHDKNIEILDARYEACTKWSRVLVDTNEIYMCLNKEALVYDIKIITDTNVIFLKQLKYYLFTSMLTAFFITLLLYSASKRTFKKVVWEVTRKEMLPIIKNTIDDLNNMFLTYNLENFDKTLDKLHVYSELFLKTNDQNYYILESKIKKLMDNAHYHYLSDHARKIYLMSKELELKYYILTKQYGHIFTNYFLLLSSKHFTSSYQLFIFLTFFCILSGVLLENLYEIPRNIDENLLFYITQAINVISNLWWELSFTTDVEYIYSIYLQMSGIIFIGILVWVVNKEIK